jgi:hypothetical protein
MSGTDPKAIDIAAQATGLRSDQVERAISAYREAVSTVQEPNWTMVSHMCGDGFGIAQYAAEGTRITLQIDSRQERGEWKSEPRYVLNGTPYEHFAEARAAELKGTVRPKPYAVSSVSPAPAPARDDRT